MPRSPHCPHACRSHRTDARMLSALARGMKASWRAAAHDATRRAIADVELAALDWRVRFFTLPRRYKVVFHCDGHYTDEVVTPLGRFVGSSVRLVRRFRSVRWSVRQLGGGAESRLVRVGRLVEFGSLGRPTTLSGRVCLCLRGWYVPCALRLKSCTSQC